MRAALAGLVVTGLVALGTPAHAAGQYPSIDPTTTQSLYGTAVPPNFLGGVAFAPDGSPLVDECAPGGSSLHKFDAATLLPTTNGTSTLHAATTIPSSAGCGLTNHPDGTLYSNTSAGVTNLDPATGALLRTIGVPGNALGIAVDPRTDDLVYVGADCTGSPTCTIYTTDPVTNITRPFAVLAASVSSQVDGIAFDPTGGYLFLSNRAPLFRVTILDRTGAVVQHVPLTRDPDGIAFHVVGTKYVVVNDNNGAVDRLDFPLNDYRLPPVVSTMASGGFRGDLSQVGPDGCLYVTQDQTRYDDGTVDPSSDSLVQFCPGFAPPPGVGRITGRSLALSLHSRAGDEEAGDTGYVSTSTASYVSTSVESVTAGGAVPVSAGVLNGTVVTSVGPFRSSAEASVADVSAGIGPLLRATGVVARSRTSCAGSSGETEIASLTVNGTPYDTGLLPPNTTVPLAAGAYVVLNEQLATVTAATGSLVLTVNAIHLVVPGVVDLVVSSATSDIHHC